MSISKTLIAVSTLFVWTMMIPSTAVAERVWDNGTVWTVGFAKTKPGHFDDYIEDLSNVWRVFLEEEKAAGDVISYKILGVASPRDGEPNLVLLVEYKNWAVFDRSLAERDAMTEKVQGSLKKSDQAQIKRGDLRDLMGGLTLQEIVLQ